MNARVRCNYSVKQYSKDHRQQTKQRIISDLEYCNLAGMIRLTENNAKDMGLGKFEIVVDDFTDRPKLPKSGAVFDL